MYYHTYVAMYITVQCANYTYISHTPLMQQCASTSRHSSTSLTYKWTFKITVRVATPYSKSIIEGRTANRTDSAMSSILIIWHKSAMPLNVIRAQAQEHNHVIECHSIYYIFACIYDVHYQVCIVFINTLSYLHIVIHRHHVLYICIYTITIIHLNTSMHNTFRSSQTNHPMLHIQPIVRQVSFGRKTQTPCPSIERISQNMIITQMTVPQTKNQIACVVAS